MSGRAAPSARTAPRPQAGACRGLARALRRNLHRFAQDRSGNVVMVFGLMAVAMCLFVGAGVDIGRWLHARHQTIAAMDAAVLAGGRQLQLDSSNLSGAIAAAKSFYAENTKGRLTLLSDTIAFNSADNGTSFTASGNAYIATPLLAFVNITKLPLLNTSGTEYSKAQAKPSGSASGKQEIALMLDVTGSMKGSKIKDLREAATDLVTIVIADKASENTARVALIPFAEVVRLPTSANAAARGSPANSVELPNPCGGKKQPKCVKYYRTDCVVERIGAEKYTDKAPGSGNYVLALRLPEDKDGKKPSCPLSSTEELVPLSSDKAMLKTRIGKLSADGRTAGHLGTAWAWYTLSPNWNSLWSTANQAAAYGTADVQKIAILMTDGEYNTEYDADGVSTRDDNAGPAANGSSTNQSRSLCAAMKDKGITVYTIGFDLGSDDSAIETLSKCASDPAKFYVATDGEQLKQAYRDIALKISQLYLTQ